MSEAPKSKVFISYSRSDAQFVEDLKSGLDTFGGFDVIIDQEGIGHGEAWRERLARLILECDTMVFVLSPDSIASDVCVWEVEQAQDLGRRIIPVLYRQIAFADAPPGLSELNAVPFVDGQVFRGLENLVAALNTDMDWLRDHTALSERAADWAFQERPADLLLRGDALRAAQDLLNRRPATAPELKETLLSYIQASEEEEARLLSTERRRLKEMEAARDAAEAARAREGAASQRLVRRTVAGLIVTVALLLASLAAGGFAYLQREEAQDQRAQAEAEAARADAEAARALDAARTAEEQRDAALLIQSRFLARTAQEFLLKGDVANALAFARRALPKDLDTPERPFAIEGVQAIFDAWGKLQEVATLRHPVRPLRPVVLKDGRIITLADDGKLRFWGPDGALIETIDAHDVVEYDHSGSVRGLMALSDNRFITWGADRTLKFWSDDGDLLDQSTYEKTPRIRRLDDGRITEFVADQVHIRRPDWSLQMTLKPDLSPVYRLSVLPSGRFAATGGSQIRKGQIFEANGTAGPVIEMPKGRFLDLVELTDRRLVARSNKTLQFWTAEGQPLQTIADAFEVRSGGLLPLPDGQLLAYGQVDFETDPFLVKVFDQKGDLAKSFQTGSFPGDAMLLSDGRIVLGAKTATPSIWTSTFEPGPVLNTGGAGIGLIETPDGRLLTYSDDATLRLWSREGREVTAFVGHERAAWPKILPDGRIVTTSFRDHSIRLWSEIGGPMSRINHDGHSRVEALSGGRVLYTSNNLGELYGPDGALMARLDHGEKSFGGVLEMDDARILTWAWGGGEGAKGPSLRFWSPEGVPIGDVDTPEEGVYVAKRTQDGGFATLGSDRKIRLRNPDGDLIRTVMEDGPPIHRLYALPDGRFAAAEVQKRLIVLDETFQPLFTLDFEGDQLNEVRLLRDGDLALHSNFNRSILIVDREGRRKLQITDERGPLISFAVLPNGGVRAVGSFRTLLEWDANGAPVQIEEAEETYSIRPLADERYIVDREGGVEFWDAAGTVIARYPHAGLRIYGAFAAADGSVVGWSREAAYLWSGDGEKEVRLDGGPNELNEVIQLSDGRLLGMSVFGAISPIWPGSIDQAIKWADAEIARLTPLTLEERCDYYLEVDELCPTGQ